MKTASMALLVLAFAAPSHAATNDSDHPDKEMLRMMDLLKDMEMIKQLDLMQDIQKVDSPAGSTARSPAGKPVPAPKREAAK
ncbi:MAG TPA: hypothetical protein VIB79_21275 [Candidatus Binatia bacterium]|jgi:hypothetical protein